MQIQKYKSTPYLYDHTRDKFKQSKAGMFIYNPMTKYILLVQSRGKKWGPPKGTMESFDIDIEHCAIREVYEETGLKIDILELVQKYRIDRATYYMIEKDVSNMKFLNYSQENDASGITWIHLDCLINMVNNKTIELNSHCKKLLHRFFNIKL